MGNKKKGIQQSAILKLIKAGYSSTQIARHTGLSKPSVTYHTNRMLKEGLIEFKKEGIERRILLTAKGARGVADSLTPPQSPATPPTKRFHAYGLRYQRLGTLKGKLEPAEMFRDSKEVGITITTLQNTTQVTIKADITAKLTTQSLILYAPDLYYHRGAPAITMEAEAKRILDEEAQRWERKRGIKLKRVRLGVLWSEIIQEEIADEGHELGKAAVPNGGQVVLARHIDGKARLTGDWSTGKKPELEVVHNKSAGEDADTVDSQFNAVLDHQISLWAIPAHEARLDRAERLIERYARNEDTHLRYIEELRATNKAILDQLRQRKIL